jgi:hypothetical protein
LPGAERSNQTEWLAQLSHARKDAIAHQRKLAKELSEKASASGDVRVSAVFISFNTAAARDKVLHELRPKTLLGRSTYTLRNTWPISIVFGDAPNFVYEDPHRPGCMIRTLLHVKEANEPSDYLWINLHMRPELRAMWVYLGFVLGVVLVCALTVLAIYLNLRLTHEPIYQGSFTMRDQLCDDPNFIKNAPVRLMPHATHAHSRPLLPAPFPPPSRLLPAPFPPPSRLLLTSRIEP